MDPTGFPPDNINSLLEILTWALLAFGALWLVTGIIGVMHRRAYNLTHAESGSSKNIQPDFLRVDKAKREAAIARGERYDAKLAEREEAPKSPIATVCTWSRVAATAAALLGLFVTIITSLQRINSLQAGVEDLSNWDKLSTIASQNQIGTVLAIAIIGSNAYMVVKSLQKPAK